MFKKILRIFKMEKSSSGTTEHTESEALPFNKSIKYLENYFKNQAVSNEAFIPEYEATKAIKEIVLKEEISESDIREIIRIFNDANQKPHYNGSGWLDLCIHIEWLLKEKKMAYEKMENNTLELVQS